MLNRLEGENVRLLETDRVVNNWRKCLYEQV